MARVLFGMLFGMWLMFIGLAISGIRDGGLSYALSPPTFYQYKVFASDGGVANLTVDEVYDLVTWAREAKARERAHGVCVPDWKEWPYYAPTCGFTRPVDPK